MTTKPTVIAFLGRAGSGKSTASKHLVESYGAKKVSFAGPLKELAKLLLNFSDEQVYGSQAIKETVDARYGFTPRQFLQNLGNGAREIIGNRVWVDGCLNTILRKSEKGEGSLFVIDDCRYVNEAAIIATDDRIRGYVVKLECPNAQTSVDPTHPSEAEVDMVPEQFITERIISEISPRSSDLLAKLQKTLDSLEIASDG